jgi:hypothetical protein
MKPPKVGVWERVEPETNETYFQYWNGEWWGSMASDPDAAHLFKTSKSKFQRDPWRGLAEEPK